MSVYLNKNKQIVDNIKYALKKNDGYCPCKVERILDNKCICKEFRDKILDKNYEGYCSCSLYYKDKK